MNKRVVLFFARGYQADFFPTLSSEAYEPVFATLTKAERLRVERLGGRVVGCFEEDYSGIPAAPAAEDYLLTSFMSDRFLGRYSYAKRLEILGKEISFWRRLMEEYSPAAAVNELVAIEISEVLLIECRARGIRYLAGMHCVFDEYFYWLKNPMTLSGAYLPHVEPGPSSLELARKYVRDLRERDYKPFYVKNLSARRSLRPLAIGAVKLLGWKLRKAASAISGGFQYEVYDDEYAKRVAVYVKSLYRRYDSLGDLPAGAEVIYFPLHQEPEATLNYMSEFYSNQAATIENILKCLGEGQVLVVKEHPVDKGSLLRSKFWRLRRGCSGLYFLPAEVHGREVLAAAHRVVTLASTAGWEAALIGKPVYVLGETFYDRSEVATPVSDFRALKIALRTRPGSASPDTQSIERFIASMAEQSYPGNPFPYTDLYSERNRRRVAEAIAAELPRIVPAGPA
jgi:hypothetical protein